MRRFFALALVCALIGLGWPSTTFAAARAQNGQISGVAKTPAGQPLANTTVRVRSVGTGQVAATAQTSAAGEFSFANLPAGTYVIEIVDANGLVIGTSSGLTLSATTTLTGVAVTSSATGSAAAAGAAGGSFFKSTGGIILLAAAGGGAVAAVVATRGDESPKK